MKGVATENAFDSEPAAAEYAVPLNRLDAIGRARGREAARADPSPVTQPTVVRRERHLVETEQFNDGATGVESERGHVWARMCEGR